MAVVELDLRRQVNRFLIIPTTGSLLTDTDHGLHSYYLTALDYHGAQGQHRKAVLLYLAGVYSP